MNIIGNKTKLLNFIEDGIKEFLEESREEKSLKDLIFMDGFSGSGSVASHFSNKVKEVLANDQQYYSYVNINNLLLANKDNIILNDLFKGIIKDEKLATKITLEEIEKLSGKRSLLNEVDKKFFIEIYFNVKFLDTLDKIENCLRKEFKVNILQDEKIIEQTESIYKNTSKEKILEMLPELKDCFIFNNYCVAGLDNQEYKRGYFTNRNGLLIDLTRKKIEHFKNKGFVSEIEYFYLLSNLLTSADKVANTTGIYGNYLKHFKNSVLKPFYLRLEPLEDKPKTTADIKIYNDNLSKVIGGA